MVTPAGAAFLLEQLGQTLGQPVGRFTLRPLAGGDINTALKADTAAGPLFIKFNASAAASAMFECEAEGLRALRRCVAVTVPSTVWHGQIPGGAALVLDFLELTSSGSEAALGAALAQLHSIDGCEFDDDRAQTAADQCRFGWWRDNFIGGSQQANGWHSQWSEFFWQRRLEPQLAAAAAAGLRISGAERTGLERRCHEFLAHGARPALVHGDLWRGNVGWANGLPALFDPAAYLGDGEVDLAMAALFGGFGERFFAAYDDLRPRPPGAGERAKLYNLYHLLNHFNLFGGAYASQCRAQVAALTG